MTTPADDTAVEDAFEAYLAGRPVPGQAAALAVFSEAVRTAATRPGRPNAALAELLATGLLTDQSSPSARTAQSAGAPPSRGASRTRNRRRFTMIFPALLAKFLSAGAIAQAATGAGLVLVVATGAGATGVLGDDVQETVTSVVGITADGTTEDDVVVDNKTGTGTGAETQPTPVVETSAPAEPTAGEFDALAWAADGPADDEPFGQWVSVAAHNKDALRAAGVSFGEEVRDWAQQKGLDDADLVQEKVDLDGLTEPTPTAAPAVEQEATVTERETVTTESGNRGDAKVADGTSNGGGGSGNSGGKGNGRD